MEQHERSPTPKTERDVSPGAPLPSGIYRADDEMYCGQCGMVNHVSRVTCVGKNCRAGLWPTQGNLLIASGLAPLPGSHLGSATVRLDAAPVKQSTRRSSRPPSTARLDLAPEVKHYDASPRGDGGSRREPSEEKSEGAPSEAPESEPSFGDVSPSRRSATPTAGRSVSYAPRADRFHKGRARDDDRDGFRLLPSMGRQDGQNVGTARVRTYTSLPPDSRDVVPPDMVGVGDFDGRRANASTIQPWQLENMKAHWHDRVMRERNSNFGPQKRFRVAVDWNGTLSAKGRGPSGLKYSACAAMELLASLGGELFLISYVGWGGPKSAERRKSVLDGAADACRAARLQYHLSPTGPPRDDHVGPDTLAIFVVDHKIGRYGKEALCKKFGITAIVDDRPEVLADCAAYGVAPYLCTNVDANDCRRSLLLACLDIFSGKVPPFLGSR